MGEPAASRILAGEGLVRRYPCPGWGRRSKIVLAVDRVTLELRSGEAVGLVGRSGAGKSSLARLLLALEPADSGEVRILERPIHELGGAELRKLRREVQLVLQDPHASLDPRQTVRSALYEPIVVHGLARPSDGRDAVANLLETVGLPSNSEFQRRCPAGLSGGERQRVAIARALACRPRALVLDEPVSALDASVRGQVVNLLLDLRARFALALLVIAHDLRLLARLCERIVVLEAGKVVEQGSTMALLTAPSHSATRALVQASMARPPLLDGPGLQPGPEPAARI